MKKWLIISLLLQAWNAFSQNFEWLPSNHYTVRPEGIQLGELMASTTYEVVLYFKNRTGHAVEMDDIHLSNRFSDENEKSIHIEKIIYPKYELAENVVDSILLEFTTTPFIKSNDIRFSVSLKWNPKNNIFSYPDFHLRFRSIPHVFSQYSQISLSKHYDVGKITLSNHMLPIPLPYSNKGSAPLVATLFRNKADAKKANLIGKMLPAGKSDSFDYETEFTQSGVFHDTLYVLTNGLDSLHEIIVSGEILQIVGNQAIMKLIGAPLNHQFDLGAVLQGESKIVSIPIKNIGNIPLIIKSVSANNTAPTWTTTPIMPNEMGVIEMKCSTERVCVFSYYFTINTTELNGAYRGRFYGRVVAHGNRNSHLEIGR